MFDTLGLSICVITFDDKSIAQSYARETQVSWPLIVDADRTLYHAYGMERGTAWQIYGPQAIWSYIKLLSRGRRLQRSASDYHQLGGDVLIDPNGIVRLHYIGEGPHDRPPISDLLAAIR
jgi:hypothetical protein